MSDVALRWDAEASSADLILTEGQLVGDAGLRTAILISLFTDARAADDDALPQTGSDRRGWWGDGFGRPSDRTGSRLWLLAREKIVPEVLAQARDYVREALAWLIEDGVASSIAVDAQAIAPDVLAIGVTVDRPAGPGRQRFDFTWIATAGIAS